MAEAVVSAVISDMVSRAISLVVGNSNGQESIQVKRAKIHHMLIKIGSVVEEARGKQITNHGTLQWLSELIDGMYQGSYFLDISQTRPEDLVNAHENKKVQHSFLLSSLNHAKRLRVVSSNMKRKIFHDDSLDEINNMVERLQRISSDLREFMVLLDNCLPICKPLSTNLYVDCQMFGRHVEREQVINFLLHNGSPSERKLDVLPIVGHVGVGKTTLIQHACDDVRVRSHFSLIMFSDFFYVTMIENSETRVVLHSKYSTGDLGNFNDSLQTLTAKLNNKRFLLIFEDVDSHKKKMLELLLTNLRCGKQGSKIIVTSNNADIASVGTVQPIKLRILPCAEFWFYFKALAFPGADFEDNCPKLAAVGMAIAKKLNGSFFGAKIVGTLLRTYPNSQFWCKALKSDVWDLPVLGSNLPYISDVASYFLSRHVTMCHINVHSSRKEFSDRTLSRLQEVCLADPLTDKRLLVDDKGNSVNLHVLLCKSVLPFHSVYYVAHCHLGV
ncbi:hypothetical protein ACP4OV_020157 [Aristida adscensionis]